MEDNPFNFLWLKNNGISRITHCVLVYVEGSESEADRYFAKYGIEVDPFKTFRLKDEPRYVLVACKVHNSDAEAFANAMRDLRHDMPILGYRDYEEFCKKAFELIEKPKE